MGLFHADPPRTFANHPVPGWHGTQVATESTTKRGYSVPECCHDRPVRGLPKPEGSKRILLNSADGEMGASDSSPTGQGHRLWRCDYIAGVPRDLGFDD